MGYTMSFASYICQGCSGVKGDYISQLYRKCDFVFLQEHGLYHNTLNGLANCGDIEYHGTCTSETNENSYRVGRRYGGGKKKIFLRISNQ